MKKLFFRLSLVAVILAVFSASYKLYALISPQQNNKCTKCHTEVTHADYSKNYIHKPMFEKSCVVCHLERVAQKRLLGLKKELEPPKGVKLIARNPLPETDLWFQVPYNDVGNEVFLKVRTEHGLRDLKKIEILPIRELHSIENDGIAPSISKIKTTVERGLFITAQITWYTDKPTESQFSYGTGTRMSDVPTEDNFSRTHKVELSALKKNTLYQFTIRSTDMFDNQESSDVLTFSTENPKPGIRNTGATERTQKGEIDLTEKIFRNGDDLVLNLAVNQPVFITMYSDRKKKKIKTQKERLEEQKEKLKAEHAGFRSKLDLTNSICQACHKDVDPAFTHPVNVFPKAGMVIPPEYPTLPDGRITCSSCHNKHASDIKHRKIKSLPKELCKGCHKEFG